MNKTKLARYRNLLDEQLTTLMHQTVETVAAMESGAGGHPDPMDRATEEEERGFDLRLRDRDRRLISKIKEALQRIDEGTFGVCVECGGSIGDARLRARPVATLCVDCKEDQERRERQG